MKKITLTWLAIISAILLFAGNDVIGSNDGNNRQMFMFTDGSTTQITFLLLLQVKIMEVHGKPILLSGRMARLEFIQ